MLAVLGCLLGAWGAQAETLKVTTLCSAPINPANGVHPLWTPVQHYRGRTFVVAPDVNLRPMVTQIDGDGKVTTVPLDPNLDYTAVADGHNRFTMGIDKEGYLHIAGDMHGYAWWASTYVARYQRQNMMYWRSNKPLDVTGGFTFAGGLNSATALPGEEWGGDSRFFNDRNGELYFSSRVRAFTGGKLSGSEPFIAYALYRYDTATGLWSALGGTAPEADTAGARKFNRVLYWEHTDAFEAYQCAPRFDNSNRLHFALGGHTAGTVGQGLIYAMSEDGGIHWKKASGAAIPGLPLRAKDGEANQGDLVIRSTKVAQQGAVCIDRTGRVAVHGDGTWRTWDGTAWVPISGGVGILGPDNMMTRDGGSTLDRTPALGQPAVRHETGFGQVFSISELGLQVENAVYAIGLPPRTNFVNATRMSVFKATFSPDDQEPAGGWTSPPATAPAIFFAQGDDARVWLSWTAVPRAASYNVKRAAARSGPYAVIARGVTQTGEFTDTGCVNGTPWFYVVSAANSAGESPDSAPVSVMPQRSTPRPPIIQTAVGRNARIVLNWLPLWPDGKSYNVKRSMAQGGPYALVAKGVEGLSYTDTGLVNDKPYHYVVSAMDAAGRESPDSRPISASPFRWIRILKYKSIGYEDKGTASASAQNLPRETAAQAFDGSLGSKWLALANTGWLQYQFAPGEPWAVTQYRLTSGQDGPGRDPKDWQFLGSDDGKTWVTLDRQSNQAFAGRNATNIYCFENPKAYSSYRLNITRNNGDGITQVAELELWADDVVMPAPGGR